MGEAEPENGPVDHFPADHFVGNEMGKSKVSRRANAKDGVSQRHDMDVVAGSHRQGWGSDLTCIDEISDNGEVPEWSKWNLKMVQWTIFPLTISSGTKWGNQRFPAGRTPRMV